MAGIRSEITTKEKTEAGDIARSLEKLVESVFVSKEFMNIITSTRFTRYECQAIAELYIVKQVSKIYRLQESDVKGDDGKWLEIASQEDKEMWVLKQKLSVNQHVANEIISYAFLKMYPSALISEDGSSRAEAVDMISGSTKKLLDPSEMSSWDKLKRRVMGSVAYPG